MKAEPATIGSGTTIEAAVRMLDEQALSAFSVVREDGLVLGVISDIDLIREMLRGAGDHGTGSVPVSASRAHVVDDIMSCYPLVIRTGSELADAVGLMASTGVRNLPVTDCAGHAVGMLTRADIVHLLARGDPEVEAEAIRLLATAGLGEWLLEVQGCVVNLLGPEGATESTSSAAMDLARTVPGVLAVHSA